MRRLEIRWYIDAFSGLPHCVVEHGVSVEEVEEVLESPAEDRPGTDGSRVAIGLAATRRIIKVVYVLDDDGAGAFVITAYPLRGKPLAAFRRRIKRP